MTSFYLVFQLIGSLDIHRELREKVIDYLSKREFTMVSFERLLIKLGPKFQLEDLSEIVDIFPETFRHATLKGGKPRGAFTNHFIESEKRENGGD